MLFEIFKIIGDHSCAAKEFKAVNHPWHDLKRSSKQLQNLLCRINPHWWRLKIFQGQTQIYGVWFYVEIVSLVLWDISLSFQNRDVWISTFLTQFIIYFFDLKLYFLNLQFVDLATLILTHTGTWSWDITTRYPKRLLGMIIFWM